MVVEDAAGVEAEAVVVADGEVEGAAVGDEPAPAQ